MTPERSGSRLEGQGSRQGVPPASSPEPAASGPHATRVLVIGPSNIGDAVLMADCVALIRRRYPDAHLTLVVGSRATSLFADDPRVQTLVDASQFDSPLGRVRLAWVLWRYQPRVVVDLRHTFYPVLLKPLRCWRYLRRPPRTLTHMRARYLWELRSQAPAVASGVDVRATEAGAERAEKDPGPLWWSPRDAAHVDGLQRRWQLGATDRVVIICPGARSHIKRWTAEGFAEVADRLIDDAHVHVILSGEPEEEPIIEEVLGRMRHRAHSAVGLTTIRQLGVLMRRASLVITNDSASLHVASACRVPTVAIFGPTADDAYGPTSPAHHTIRRRLFCAPCERSLCRFSHECMRFVTPDEVVAAAIDLLQGRGLSG